MIWKRVSQGIIGQLENDSDFAGAITMPNSPNEKREPNRRVLSPEEIARQVRDHVRFRRGQGGRRASFRFCDVSRADLSHQDLTEADLTGAKLYQCRLIGTTLDDANLYGADLRFANLLHGQMNRADLRGACLFSPPCSCFW